MHSEQLSIRSLKNSFHDRKLIVVGCAPSLLTLDLSLLSDQRVITVSNGHRLKGFNTVFTPDFHIIPNITYTDKTTPQFISSWILEIETALAPQTELIISAVDYEVLKSQGHQFLRNVRCVRFAGPEIPPNNLNLPDLSTSFPPVWSVSIMALLFGLYLSPHSIGFIGIDHDWFIKKSYTYAFDDHTTRGYDQSVTEEGHVKSKLLDDIPVIFRLFRQYRYISNIARSIGIPIYNCSNAGAVDEFPRMQLHDFVRARCP